MKEISVRDVLTEEKLSFRLYKIIKQLLGRIISLRNNAQEDKGLKIY